MIPITPRMIIGALYVVAAFGVVGGIAYFARAPLRVDLAALEAQIKQQKIDAKELLDRKAREVKEADQLAKAKIATLEKEAADAKAQRDALHRSNVERARALGLRHLSGWEGGRDTVPEAPNPAPVNHAACARQLSATLERMAEWAREADQVRQQAITCQNYLR